jgi:hypothetical protein
LDSCRIRSNLKERKNKKERLSDLPQNTSCMVHIIFNFAVLDFFKEYFSYPVVTFLGLGLGLMCANRKQNYDGHIH